jgi:hypothetical protein
MCTISFVSVILGLWLANGRSFCPFRSSINAAKTNESN